jgi:4-diphosphocytidyl-2-C-methyl-D-erythritol kinase
MVSFPNCKINIGLNITGKRADGFHNLETVFYPIGIKDALEIIPTKEEQYKDVIFTSSGNVLDIRDEDNLCVKAYRLLKKDYPQIPSIHIHLHKNIPMGAGMGGGSADASAVLVMLNTKFDLQISTKKLMEYALMLGSDCPFFIINKTCLAKGRGEILTALSLDLSAYQLLVVNPGIHINTAMAFSKLDSATFSNESVLEKNITKPISEWKNNISNDFEKPVFELHPPIEVIKNRLYENGAIYSAMSGSGSSVFGIFAKDTIPQIKFPAHYFCQVV